MIPAEAVEAAAKTFYGAAWDDCSPEDLEYALGQMRETLESAAPHIRAQALEDVANSRETERLFVFGWEARERLRTRAAAERGGE